MMGFYLDESIGNLEIWCDMCKQPYTHTTEDGMFCDLECERLTNEEYLGVLKHRIDEVIEIWEPLPPEGIGVINLDYYEKLINNINNEEK